MIAKCYAVNIKGRGMISWSSMEIDNTHNNTQHINIHHTESIDNTHNNTQYINVHHTESIDNTHNNTQHIDVHHTESGTPILRTNHRACVEETYDKTKRNTREKPTTPVRFGKPTQLTNMDTHHR